MRDASKLPLLSFAYDRSRIFTLAGSCGMTSRVKETTANIINFKQQAGQIGDRRSKRAAKDRTVRVVTSAMETR